jgi:hypothetical protein
MINSEEGAEQHTARDKLKEEHQIMWCKVKKKKKKKD